MLKVDYAWHHIAGLCDFPHHEKCDAHGVSSQQFLDEGEALVQFARYNSGGVRCYRYAITGIERVPHRPSRGGK